MKNCPRATECECAASKSGCGSAARAVWILVELSRGCECDYRAHAQKAIERMAGESTVLAIQDTTELDYSHHRGTRGLGEISKAGARGLKVHSVLAASAEGVPLGVLHQQVWSRPALRRADEQRRVSIEEKESRRWLTSLEVTGQLVLSSIK